MLCGVVEVVAVIVLSAEVRGSDVKCSVTIRVAVMWQCTDWQLGLCSLVVGCFVGVGGL